MHTAHLSRFTVSAFLAALAALAALAPTSEAHPVPDVPVQASFGADGSVSIRVEVDLRCFADNPTDEPYTLHWVLKEMTETEREAQRDLARTFIRRVVEFQFEPEGRFVPDFSFEFTAPGGKPLSKIDDVVVITGEWTSKLPAGTKGYRIHALPVGDLSVIFLNELCGAPVKRKMVLFPSETSFLLDLSGLAGGAASG